MSLQRVLIVGLGIAGMSAAHSLRKAGWTPTIVERSPERRTGGYFIGLFPEGQEAATELGVYDYIHRRNPEASTTWNVSNQGERSVFPAFDDQPGKPDSLLRGDVEAALWGVIENEIEVRFATTPTAIEQDAAGVRVTLKNTITGIEETEEYDLVVGADGLRSTVRKLVFGPHDRYMKSLDAIICAFQLPEQVDYFRDQDGIIIAEPGRALWVFPLADHAPTVLFTYRTTDIDAQFKSPPAEVLRERFKGLSAEGVVESALADLEKTSEYLFDSVYQVRMPKWYQDRVVLTGDAAWCLTLYSGKGATAGLKGGYELGKQMLEHPGDLRLSLQSWDRSLRSFIVKNQHTAYLKRELFVPSDKPRAIIRNLLLTAAGRRIIKRRAGTPVTLSLDTSEQTPRWAG